MASVAAPVMNGLEPVDDVLGRLRKRKFRRLDTYIQNAIDLGFQFRESGVGFAQDTYTMKIDGKELPLTEGAVKTAAALIGQKNPAWFQKFGDPQYFPKSFRNYNHQTGFLVRHDENNVYAVLPETYIVADALDLLGDNFLPMLEDTVGNAHGIAQVYGGIDEGDDETYRIVIGANVMPALSVEMGQYMMLQVSTSDHGLKESKVWLGMYRPVSQTAALRGQTACKWSHKTEGESFFNRAAETVRGMGSYQQRFQALFAELLTLPLPSPDDGQPIECADMLTLLKRGKLITKAHYDAALSYANGVMEDGRRPKTQYDCYNCLTRGAGDLPNLEQRHKAEEVAMLLFTSQGGLVEQLKRAYDRMPDGGGSDE